MLCPKKLLKENFPNDMEYTFHALVEQLALMELHIRDGSWKLCSCNPEKHLPVVAGLASEGFGFAETDDERHFMECLMSQARVFKAKIKSGEYRTQGDMNTVKNWAREARHRLEVKNWSGEWKRLETGGDSEEIMRDITKILTKLRNNSQPIAAHETDMEDFLVMEKEMAEQVIAILSEKYGVDPPELVISDECHEPEIGLYTPDRIMVCKTGINLHVLAHEFWHHVQARNGMHMDEGEAEKFAITLFASPPQKGLYAFHSSSHNERKMVEPIERTIGLEEMNVKDVGIIYVLNGIGFTAEYGLNYLDTLRPEGILGQPVSFWGDLGGAILGFIGAVKLQAPMNLVSAMIGSYLATELIKHGIRMYQPIERIAVPPRIFTPPMVFTPPATIVRPASIAVGRYAVVA